MKKKRNRKLGLILALAMILVCIPVHAQKLQTAEQKYAQYYKRNPVYQRGLVVVFPKQRLKIKNAMIDKRNHRIYYGTKTIKRYMFDEKGNVTFYCLPTGSAGRYLPGRGAKDPFYSCVGIKKVWFDGWVISQKTLKRCHGHRVAIRINIQGNQYSKLSKHGKWWWLEDYFK